MTTAGSESLERARQAQKKIIAQFLGHPDVQLIDIGLDPQQQTKEIVIRVHVKQSVQDESLQIPEEVDGVPVRIIRSDIHLE